MIEIGYALSSEEHTALDLVSNASAAEEAGFSFALISDHFHPWIDRQGQSPFVWSVLGGIAGATEKLSVGTGVTCPMIRTHPAIIAQAAATTATLMPDRFFLGLGHRREPQRAHPRARPGRSGTSAPRCSRRPSRSSATLWSGEVTSHRGRHYTVQNARIYSLPENAAADLPGGRRREGRPAGRPASATA